jgi:hypothetical protein
MHLCRKNIKPIAFLYLPLLSPQGVSISLSLRNQHQYFPSFLRSFDLFPPPSPVPSEPTHCPKTTLTIPSQAQYLPRPVHFPPLSLGSLRPPPSGPPPFPLVLPIALRVSSFPNPAHLHADTHPSTGAETLRSASIPFPASHHLPYGAHPQCAHSRYTPSKTPRKDTYSLFIPPRNSRAYLLSMLYHPSTDAYHTSNSHKDLGRQDTDA